MRKRWKEVAVCVTVVTFLGALALVAPGCSTVEGLARDVTDMSKATRNAMQR
jgi:predicted small secreted protein